MFVRVLNYIYNLTIYIYMHGYTYLKYIIYMCERLYILNIYIAYTYLIYIYIYVRVRARLHMLNIYIAYPYLKYIYIYMSACVSLSSIYICLPILNIYIYVCVRFPILYIASAYFKYIYVYVCVHLLILNIYMCVCVRVCVVRTLARAYRLGMFYTSLLQDVYFYF